MSPLTPWVASLLGIVIAPHPPLFIFFPPPFFVVSLVSDLTSGGIGAPTYPRDGMKVVLISTFRRSVLISALWLSRLMRLIAGIVRSSAGLRADDCAVWLFFFFAVVYYFCRFLSMTSF